MNLFDGSGRAEFNHVEISNKGHKQEIKTPYNNETKKLENRDNAID